MAKVPEPGKVKTRLVGALSAEQAAKVQEVFIRHTMTRLSGLGAPELVMCFDPPEAGRAMHKLVGSIATRYVAQPPGDLGARMDAAAREIAKWYGKLLFVGVDSPDVPVSHLTRAAELLRDNEVVVGPSGDGGFWCIGLQHHVSPKLLFEGVESSSGKECGQTLARARELDCACAQADSWDDVDRPEDLHRLLSRLGASADEHDRQLLGALGFAGQGCVGQGAAS
jgi:rSAM/selenodomain-associated transferase 1